MNRIIVILVFFLLSLPLFAQNDSIKLRPKQQIEYRHNISANVSPVGVYLKHMISNGTTESSLVGWNAAIRYTYTIHPNILIGGEASYFSFESFSGNSQKNQGERKNGYWVYYYGPMVRFVYNGLKWCRPFADIEMGYRRLYWFHEDLLSQEVNKPKLMDIRNSFQWYAAAGVSFRFWKNHFNIDVMFRASNWYYIGGKWDVTWKIGYNFNGK